MTNLIGHIHPTVAEVEHVSQWSRDCNEVVDSSGRVEKNNQDTRDHSSPHSHPLMVKDNI